MPGRLVGVWAPRIEIVYGPHGGIAEVWWLSDHGGARMERVTGFAGLTRQQLHWGGVDTELVIRKPDGTVQHLGVTIWRETWSSPSYLTPVMQAEGV